MDLRSLEPGDRKVRFTITDLLGGTTATAERHFVVEEQFEFEPAVGVNRSSSHEPL
ncbi:MAG: hypothetical protein GWN99_10020 [Gemmatimonadetes bacterium]|uniref:Uncharacterized protein n=1 Tax=Candidatus Kutchimonas denitrificans TaxID=3056748 RepID=A0AAE5CBA8_9BACT|nr:hypothetical protein [Gemmatimonadota bacterium]NIR74328.1 hypothetical protein [Candidatus Kutchimonas denitrificans]NIS01384.1 hypothetical protein [Gemmatimonadota bacterium]NIT67124.1 hypothetical protein [Gemmatimonadota bacterium]NIU52780.1 hypothetical protein [Gemmatimonadota bacterium]